MKFRKALIAGVAIAALALAGCKSTGPGAPSVSLPSLSDVGSFLSSPGAKAFEKGVVCAASSPGGHDAQQLEQMLGANLAVVLVTGLVITASAKACQDGLGGVPGPAA